MQMPMPIYTILNIVFIALSIYIIYAMIYDYTMVFKYKKQIIKILSTSSQPLLSSDIVNKIPNFRHKFFWTALFALKDKGKVFEDNDYKWSLVRPTIKIGS